jgi:hypothetical protein
MSAFWRHNIFPILLATFAFVSLCLDIYLIHFATDVLKQHALVTHSTTRHFKYIQKPLESYCEHLESLLAADTISRLASYSIPRKRLPYISPGSYKASQSSHRRERSLFVGGCGGLRRLAMDSSHGRQPHTPGSTIPHVRCRIFSPAALHSLYSPGTSAPI